MDQDIKNQIIKALKDYNSLLEEQREEILSKVGDLAEAESLSVYNDITDKTDEISDLLEIIDTEDFNLSFED